MSMNEMQRALLDACMASKNQENAARLKKQIDDIVARSVNKVPSDDEIKKAINTEYGTSRTEILAEKVSETIAQQEENVKRVWEENCKLWGHFLPYQYSYHPFGKYTVAFGVIVAHDKDEAYKKVLNMFHTGNAKAIPAARSTVEEADIRVSLLNITGVGHVVYHEEHWE